MGIVLSGVLILGVAIALPLLPGYGESGTVATIGVGYQLPQLQGLKDPNTFVPADNPLTAEKVELGRLLFFDKRLSQNNTIACASCHLPEKGFTDGMPVSTGINNLKGGRSAPASINRAYSQAQFWDGRAETLEDQSIGPFVDPVEHGFMNHDEMVAKMRQIPGYRKLFQDVFSREIVIEDVGRAIASYQRTILSGNSAMDKFDRGWEEEALSESAQRGLDLFRVAGLQPRRRGGRGGGLGAGLSHDRSLPERTATRVRVAFWRPSRSTMSTRVRMRVGDLVSGSTTATLLT